MFVCGFVVGVGCFNCRDCNLDKQMIMQFCTYIIYTNIFIGKNVVAYQEMWQKYIHISNQYYYYYTKNNNNNEHEIQQVLVGSLCRLPSV